MVTPSLRVSIGLALSLACQFNKANQDYTPMTLVQDAEFIWARLSEGDTQKQVAQIVGWNRSQVANYGRLQDIDKQAWQEIATTFAPMCGNSDDEDVADTATIVASPFTEGLLRYLVHLKRFPEQQRQLVHDFIRDTQKGKADKAQWKARAEYRKAENHMVAEAKRELKGLPEEYLAQPVAEIPKGLDGSANCPSSSIVLGATPYSSANNSLVSPETWSDWPSFSDRPSAFFSRW